MTNDETAETRPSGIDLNGIYYVLFRHKWKILICFVVGIVSSAAVYFLRPPRYQSEALLFVRYVMEKENKSLEPTATAVTSDCPSWLLASCSDVCRPMTWPVS